MEMKSGTLDKWRNYFRTADSNIFDIIEHAIIVAASDRPTEFRVRRDRIAEKLFSCKLSRCLRCDRVELAVPCADNEEREETAEDEEDGGCKSGFDRDDGCEFEAGVSNGSKVNSTSRDEQGMELNMNQVSKFSYGEAQALTDEIEEETQIFREVLRIKEIVDNSQDESEPVLFESLRRLQLMRLSVEILRATGIGKAVTVLRRHASKQIGLLARTLIKEWKVMVDEWYIATEAIAAVENTPESGKTSVTNEEEEGLPSPPLDEGAFFTTTTMELSQFFDGIDDDGNPRGSGEFHRNHGNGSKSSLDNDNIATWKEHLPGETKNPSKEKNAVEIKKQDAIVKKQTTVIKPNKPSSAESGSGRLTKSNGEGKLNRESKIVPKTDKVTMQRKPAATQQDVKLEATKRKLQERYQQAENAKRQRTIQVMDIHDLPKQGLVHNNQHARHGNHNRHFSYGRH